MKYFSLILITLLIFGCSKKENNSEDRPQVPRLLKKRTPSPHGFVEYEYYDDGRLKKATKRISYEMESVTQYVYDMDTTWVYENFDPYPEVTDTLKMYKMDETRSLILSINQNYSFYPYYSTEYFFSESEACGYTSFIQYASESYPVNFMNIDYTDNNCSEHSLYNNNNTIHHTEDLIRDGSHHSWETSITLDFYRKGDFGNIIERTRYQDGNLEFHATYEYEFNYDGYPTRMIQYGITEPDTTYFEYY